MNGETLGKQTWMMVAVLVGACVAFVGTTSTAAVLITAKVVGPRENTADEPARVTAATPRPSTAKKDAPATL